MGKATRRKKNRQKRKDQQTPLHGNGDSASLSSVISNPQSAVHRLRHTDPRIRHEALVALQASVLSQIRCGGGSRQVSLKVLQAVREQVTSSDLECSAVAAECMAQYLSDASSSGISDQQKQTTASWTLVLLGRLDDCRKALVEQQQQSQSTKSISENQRKKAEKIRKQWYAISAPCFIALCQLIESNGHALNQINLQKKTFVDIAFGLLSLGLYNTGSSQVLDQASKMGEDTAMNDSLEEGGLDAKTIAHDAIFEKLKKTTELYAARSLHSALDDNWELAEVLKNGECMNAWKTLLGGIAEKKVDHDGSTSDAILFPVTTRLHLIGCLVNLYQLALYSDDRSASLLWQEELLMEYGLKIGGDERSQGLLTQILLSRETQPDVFRTKLSTQEHKFREAQALLEKQKDDEKLEAEVDAQVRERKEPAKLIARRQKKMKELKREKMREQQKARMIAEAEGAMDDTDMMDTNDDVGDKEHTSSQIIDREQDGEEAVNEAMLEWTNTTGQIQLALEILTNLVSTWISAPEGPRPASKLFHLMNTIDTTSRLRGVLQTFSQFLRDGKIRNQQNDMDDDESKSTFCEYERDDPIRMDIEETIGKISACLINCILSGIVVTTRNDIASSSCPVKDLVWNPMLRDLHTELNENMNGQKSPDANDAVVEAYTAVLVVVMETNAGIVFQGTENTNLFQEYIELFQKLLPRRDAICLLSTTVLTWVNSSGTATANIEAVVRLITERFMELLAKKLGDNYTVEKADLVNSQLQVLKTFMDWYGNDNFYPQLYNEMKISSAIASFLMSMSKELNSSNTTGNSTTVDEEQMDILHNSERFIEYKKNL